MRDTIAVPVTHCCRCQHAQQRRRRLHRASRAIVCLASTHHTPKNTRERTPQPQPQPHTMLATTTRSLLQHTATSPSAGVAALQAVRHLSEVAAGRKKTLAREPHSRAAARRYEAGATPAWDPTQGLASALLGHSPFTGLGSLGREMDHLMKSVEQDLFGTPSPFSSALRASPFSGLGAPLSPLAAAATRAAAAAASIPQLRMDVREGEGEYTIRVEVPGLPKEGLKIDVDDERHAITLVATHQEEKPAPQAAHAAAAPSEESAGDAKADEGTAAAAAAEGATGEGDKLEAAAEGETPKEGETAKEGSEEGGSWLVRERTFGTASRTVFLPDDADTSAISDAELKDGVLCLVVPKREAHPTTRPLTIK